MEKEIEMLRVKQERIDKMNILTALQEEKNMIEEAIRYQNKIHMKSITEMEFDLDKDLSKLKSISHQQQEQLQVFSYHHKQYLCMQNCIILINVFVDIEERNSNTSFESKTI